MKIIIDKIDFGIISCEFGNLEVVAVKENSWEIILKNLTNTNMRGDEL